MDQLLYEMQVEALGIPQLFTDVKEPLEALRREKEQAEEVRRRIMDEQRRQAEKEQSRRENKLNRMLTWVGALAIFSALVDSYQFFGSFFGDIGVLHGWIFAVQIICIILIAFVAWLVIRELVKGIREDWKNQSDQRE